MSRYIQDQKKAKYAHLIDLEKDFPHLPFNMEAEQGLLAALLVDNRCLEKVSHFLKAEHFYTVVHGQIYTAICTLAAANQNASPVTLKKYFETHSHLEALGGGGVYLADLAENCISVINAEDYARNIYQMHQRRALMDIAHDLEAAAQDYDYEADNPAALIEQAEARLYQLAETGSESRSFRTLNDFAADAVLQAEAAVKAGGAVTGVTTGLAGFNKKLGGLQDSDLIILAGRPAMGKTALAVNIGYNAAKAYADSGGTEGGIVGFFSLEMSGQQLAARILAELSRIPSDTMRTGAASLQDLTSFARASRDLVQIPFFINDDASHSISNLRTKARRLKRQHGLDLLIVDYLQLLSGTGSKQGADSRVNEVSEISRGLKALAKELNIPVLALSQLSRAVEQREDKRPLLSDLRESGSIEQDADVVIFVYREEYYLAGAEPTLNTERHMAWQEALTQCHNKAEAIIAKQRHGWTGAVKLAFDPSFTKFTDADER